MTATPPPDGPATRSGSLTRRQKVRRALLFSFLLLFPVTFNYYSPALPIMGTFERVACFSLLFWIAWTLGSFFFGRAGCGYLCPLGALQELWDYAVDRPLRRVRFVSILKYVVFAAWVGMILFAAIRAGGWQRVDLLYQTENVVSWDSPDRVIIYVGMFGLVMLLCLPLGRRAFCHYLCWWSPLNMAGVKVTGALGAPSLHLRGHSKRCVGCGTCDRGCPMSLPVNQMVARGAMDHTECILCGTCVDNCRSRAIRYAWQRSGRSNG